MRTELAELHKKLGTTFIYVTHDQTEAMTMGDRNVVMTDGLIQQVDTPQHLYSKPVNMFVAGFIGSPQMNFINATLEKTGDKIVAKFGDFTIDVPAEKNVDNKLNEYVGKDIVIGVRPEDIYDDEESIEKYSNGIVTAKVEVTELMGA